MEAPHIAITVSAALLAAFAGFVMYSLEQDHREGRLSKAKGELAAAQSEFESVQGRSQRAENRLAEAKRNTGAIKALMDRHNTVLDTIASTKNEIARQRKRLDELAAQRLAAIGRVRASGVGMEFPTLEVGAGKTLQKAKLQKVAPDSLTFSHSFGYATVNWRDLPGELVDRFRLADPEPEEAKETEETAALPDLPEIDPALLVPPPPGGKDHDAILKRMEQIKLQISQLRTLEGQWNRKAAEYQMRQARANAVGRPASHSAKAQEARRQAERIAAQIQTLERALLELGQQLDALR